MILVNMLVNLHHVVFSILARWADSWLLGLAARLVFLAVLALYFWNSALTKLGDGFLAISDSAYFQILGEEGMLAYDFDTANIPFHIDAVVFVGTYMEFLLPALIIIGLFTRIAAIGMTIFILVQSWVDIYVHKVEPGTIGSLFDRHSDAVIMDQRALWLFLLLVLILKGAGVLSLDRLARDQWQIYKKRPVSGAPESFKSTV